MKNYYEILEVNKKAAKEVIEKAYKVLVKKYHPDLQKTGKQIIDKDKDIREINEAYDVLSNDFLREQYDKEYEKQKNASYKVEQKEVKKEEEEIENLNTKMEKHKVGSFSGLITLVKELYKNKPKREELKEVTKRDILALILTIIIVISIGIVLWFIPFTNGWMRELLFENPISQWIGGLF